MVNVGGRILDKGIWMILYDLPMEGRDAYLAWLPGLSWTAHYASVDSATIPKAKDTSPYLTRRIWPALTN